MAFKKLPTLEQAVFRKKVKEVTASKVLSKIKHFTRDIEKPREQKINKQEILQNLKNTSSKPTSKNLKDYLIGASTPFIPISNTKGKYLDTKI